MGSLPSHNLEEALAPNPGMTAQGGPVASRPGQLLDQGSPRGDLCRLCSEDSRPCQAGHGTEEWPPRARGREDEG